MKRLLPRFRPGARRLPVLTSSNLTCAWLLQPPSHPSLLLQAAPTPLSALRGVSGPCERSRGCRAVPAGPSAPLPQAGGAASRPAPPAQHRPCWASPAPQGPAVPPQGPGPAVPLLGRAPARGRGAPQRGRPEKGPGEGRGAAGPGVKAAPGAAGRSSRLGRVAIATAAALADHRAVALATPARPASLRGAGRGRYGDRARGGVVYRAGRGRAGPREALPW